MISQVIEISRWALSKHCILFCPVCETETKHVLSTSRQFYACSCGGHIVDVVIEEEE